MSSRINDYPVFTHGRVLLHERKPVVEKVGVECTVLRMVGFHQSSVEPSNLLCRRREIDRFAYTTWRKPCDEVTLLSTLTIIFHLDGFR